MNFFEQLLHTQITDFFDKKKNVIKKQFEYQKRSTVDENLQLVETVLSSSVQNKDTKKLLPVF